METGSAKGEPQQKFCELYKVSKGVENPAWKNHNTKGYRSKVYYKKRMASTSPDEPPFKKSKPTVVLVTQLGKVLRKKSKSVLIDVMLAISAI